MPEIKFEYDDEYVTEKIRRELNACNDKKERDRIKEATGLDKQYINNMLQQSESKQKISLPVLHLFAQAIGKPVEYFLYDKTHFIELTKNEFIDIRYVESTTDSDNHLIYRDNKPMCALRLSNIMQIANDPFKTIILIIDSDTMESTFSKGDELLIDTSIKTIKDGGIYAFNSYEIKYIRIRRFFCEINTFQLIADNKIKYGSCSASPKDINIIGQVIINKHFLI